jgi:2-keto-4-pentenoate hydratase/2-oxohepta-3-ene-1,7-dioic acid hydratase in catechol pathway
MTRFKLLTYRDASGQARAGVEIGGMVHDAARLTGHAADLSVLAMIEDWAAAEPRIAASAQKAGGATQVGAMDGLTLLAPLLYPGSIFCAAANYADHADAMARKMGRPGEPDPKSLGLKPFHFLKPVRQSVVGTGVDIELPDFAQKIDWEIELAAVIGRPARHVSVQQALDHVAGYTIANDVSVRDAQFLRRLNVPDGSHFKTDFIGMKGFDKSCVLGPCITPASQIGDPDNLVMKLWLDDELMQNSNTGKMIFSTAEQIAYLSERVTLLPGDIVLTGTPAGTGAEQDRFLRPGQTIRMWIENIGETLNRTA